MSRRIRLQTLRGLNVSDVDKFGYDVQPYRKGQETVCTSLALTDKVSDTMAACRLAARPTAHDRLLCRAQLRFRPLSLVIERQPEMLSGSVASVYGTQER